MNKQHQHTAPEHRYHLPAEVLSGLAHESEEERAGLVEAWDLADYYLAGEPDDAQFRELGIEIWQNLETTLFKEKQEQNPASPHLRLIKTPLRLIKSSSYAGVAVAACITVLIAVGLVFLQRPITITAPNGAQLTHTLPDGTTITLNSGTRLQYARNFGETDRAVELIDGEAFFDVTKSEKPFNITTFNGTVSVLGTSFNVRARSDDVEPATVVAVASGTVQLTAHNYNNVGVILKAGQSARLAPQYNAPKILDSTDTQNALAWRTGSFKFRDDPIGTITKEIERRFDVHIEVLSEHLRAEPIGVLIENPLGAEEILSDICGLNRCQYRVVPGGFELFQPAAE